MQLDSSPKDGQGCLGGQDALLTMRLGSVRRSQRPSGEAVCPGGGRPQDVDVYRLRSIQVTCLVATKIDAIRSNRTPRQEGARYI